MSTLRAAASTTTNVVDKMVQLHHEAGANVADVTTAVEELEDIIVSLKLPTYSDGNTSAASANDSTCITMPVDCKLEKAYICTTPTITSTATDTVLIAITVNGDASATFNSDTLTAATGVNAVSEITVNTTNSFLDAGEVLKIAYTMEDNTNNYIEGELVLAFRRL